MLKSSRIRFEIPEYGPLINKRLQNKNEIVKREQQIKENSCQSMVAGPIFVFFNHKTGECAYSF